MTPCSSSALAVTSLKMLAAGNTAFTGSPRRPGAASLCSTIASTRPVDGSSTTTAAQGVWYSASVRDRLS